MCFSGRIYIKDNDINTVIQAKNWSCTNVWKQRPFFSQKALCDHQPQLEHYFPAGDSRGGSQLGIWPLDTTQRPLLQCKTRAHFSIRSFSPESPLTTIRQPIRYMRIIHHLGAQSEQSSQLNLEEEERAELNWPELHPSLLFLPADECSRSYNISWRAMAISKYKAINDKAKTSHTAIVQRQHKKKVSRQWN